MKKATEFKEPLTTCFVIEYLVELTGVRSSDLRRWGTGGHVRLLSSTLPGTDADRGNEAQYSIRDALQFLLFAKLSKFSISPSAIDDECMGEIMNIVLERLNEIAAGWLYGDSVNPFIGKKRNEKFLYIFPHNGKLRSDELYGSWDGGEWITIDVVHFVTSVLRIYNRRTGRSPV